MSNIFVNTTQEMQVFNKIVPFQGEIILENLQEKERMLLAALRRGDSETGYKALGEMLQDAETALPSKIENFRYKSFELLVILSRAAASNSSNCDEILEINNRYFKRIQESNTKEEIRKYMRLALDQMAGRIFSFQGIRHASVLRKAERFIWRNYTRKVGLDEISRASGLSAPYFSTIFKEEMGENLSSYLNRLRVERAATLLTETGKSLTEISSLCGFKDKSWFSKIFKAFFGVSPGKYRETGNHVIRSEQIPIHLSDKPEQNKYPIDKERKLLSALSRGDIELGKQVLYEIIMNLMMTNQTHFAQNKYRAMEIAILLTRLGIGSGFPEKIMLESRNRSINLIHESKNMEKLSEILCKIVDGLSDQIISFQGLNHASALKKAEGFIMENFTRKISLGEIASASGFSAPYFSTIFKNERGENLSSYLNRLRVEKAKKMLTNTNIPLNKITRVCGFEDQCWFSKIFKLYAGTSPGKYRSHTKAGIRK